MAFPDGYVYHNGFWYKESNGAGPYYVDEDGTAVRIMQPLSSVTEATLPTASAANTDQMYFITDRRGGTLVKSNGVSMVEIAPGLSDYTYTEVWANRTNGSAEGELRKFTSVATVGGVSTRTVMMQWDATNSIWRPASGEQLLYRLAGKVSSSSGTDVTATVPQVTIKGGAMGIFGELYIECAGGTTDGTAPTALKPQCSWDGTATFETTTGQGTKKNWAYQRNIKNDNSASSQIIMQGNADLGGAFASSNAFQTTSKNTANDRTIDGSCNATYASAKVQQIHKFDIWLRG